VAILNLSLGQASYVSLGNSFACTLLNTAFGPWACSFRSEFSAPRVETGAA
jgi:hypothetical protein